MIKSNLNACLVIITEIGILLISNLDFDLIIFRMWLTVWRVYGVAVFCLTSSYGPRDRLFRYVT